MQVDLKVGKVRKRQVAKTALLDAVIWYWLHQMSYESLFTQQTNGLPVPSLISALVTAITGAVVLLAKWDRIPVAFRMVAPPLASFSALLLFLSDMALPQVGTLEGASLVLLAFSILACQILRIENLAKCDDVKTLTMALFGSLLLYYVISFVLLMLPYAVYDAFVVLSPLVLLVGARTPLPLTERTGKVSRKTFLSTPNLLVILFGGASGFVMLIGDISSAGTLGDLLTAPSPSYLLMLLLYMDLGVIVSFGLRFGKAMYFVVMNMAWTLGALLGSLLLRLIPAVPDYLPAVVSVAVVASFFLFQSTWLEAPKQVVSLSGAAQGLAQAKGLSKRETEVVLLLLEGRSLRYIQNALFISEGTARTHVKRIYAKLEVHSKQQLIDFFKENA